MRYVVIMAGGSGTRLWPLSRKGIPKQLLSLVGDKSLLRIAYERLDGVVPPERVLVCTGASYADLVREQLPELPAENFLGEPIGRDSLNAVAWPAAVLQAKDPDAVVAMVTADQIIEPVERFAQALDQAFTLAETEADVLVTLGVVPTSPHTGYGYLHRGAEIGEGTEAYEVLDFTEKPALATAEEYLESGDYWWNAGMFVWRTGVLLDQLRQLVPDSYEIVTTLAADPDRVAELYPRLPRISVDYAIMEPVSRGAGSARVVAVGLPIDWQDVGGYLQLAEHLPHDDQGNVAEGEAVHLDGADNVVINRGPSGHLVATVGLSDMIIVTSGNVTLVCPRSESERIKELVGEVVLQAGAEYS